MSVVPVTAPRWFSDGSRVIMPAKPRWLVLAFLCVWLVGWTFGGVQAVRQVIAKTEPFLVVWLVGWAVGEIAVLFTVLWQLTGREWIQFSEGALRLRSEVGGIGRTREFDLTRVHNLRAVPVGASPWGQQGRASWGRDAGAVAFDYGAKTYRFGGSLEEAEAKLLVQYLVSIAPQIRDNQR